MKVARMSAFYSNEAFAAPGLGGESCSCCRRDHQAPGRSASIQALFDEVLETTSKIERKQGRYGVILLNRKNHKQHQ